MSTETAVALARYQARRRFVLFLVIMAAGVVLLFSGSALGQRADRQVEDLGFVFIVIGLMGRLWSILYIDGRKSVEVVQSGPYSIMRNPLYFFSTIAVAGVGAQAGSFTIALASALICAICFHFVALREERFLKERLGQAYIDYQSRVPRFLPRFSIYRDLDEVTFRPRILYKTLLDGLVFLLAVPAFEIIEEFQAHGRLPVFLQLY